MTSDGHLLKKIEPRLDLTLTWTSKVEEHKNLYSKTPVLRLHGSHIKHTALKVNFHSKT